MSEVMRTLGGTAKSGFGDSKQAYLEIGKKSKSTRKDEAVRKTQNEEFDHGSD